HTPPWRGGGSAHARTDAAPSAGGRGCDARPAAPEAGSLPAALLRGILRRGDQPRAAARRVPRAAPLHRASLRRRRVALPDLGGAGVGLALPALPFEDADDGLPRPRAARRDRRRLLSDRARLRGEGPPPRERHDRGRAFPPGPPDRRAARADPVPSRRRTRA